MVPIVLLSVLWLTFLLERAIRLARSRVVPRGLVREIEALPAGPIDRGTLAATLERWTSCGARVLATAREHIDQPREELEAAVNATGQREAHELRRYTGLFAVIASVAPLLGLLGTVTGMIQAFREVAIEGLGSGQALAPGIYQALVTTAAGLIVAIPALLTYHWFLSRIENYIHEMNDLVIRFVDAHRARAAAGTAAARGGDGAAAAEAAREGAAAGARAR
jgi:biopolymer transport protein ExbB